MFAKLKQKLCEKIRKLNQDDSGSAFVFVLIGVMFTSILGATVLSMATNYVITVIVDNSSTDLFYEDDGIVAEIRSGLEEVAGECNEDAYMEVIENYNSSDSELQKKYGINFLRGIASKLTGSNVTWDGTNEPEAGAFDLDIIKKMVRYPDAVKSTYAANMLKYGFHVDPTTEEMTLKISGLKLDITDEQGYRTTISTDMNIGVPDYGFEGDDTLGQLKHYIVISDGTMTVRNDVGDQAESVRGADFVGSVYTGGNFTGNKDYNQGIVVDSQAKASFKSQNIITRGSLEMKNGSNVSVKAKGNVGNLWVKNILLKAAADPKSLLQTKLDLDTYSYVLDDLTIDANNSIVNLAGNYYGYSFNEMNTNSAGTQKSVYSSAILVNGKNTMLSANGLSKLILAGRTFVSRNDSDKTPLVSDIMMGESLAVKSNQIAYMLPEEYIKGEHNPLVRSEVVNPDTLIADCVRLEVLKLSDIWQYLDHTNPVTPNYSNEGGYVFLYLNFKDQVSANKYFSAYYSKQENKDSLDEKAETYISTTDLNGMKLSASLYLLAGNIVHNYYQTASGSSMIEADYFDATDAPNVELLQDGAKKMQNYLGRQLTLLNSGYRSSFGTYRYEKMDASKQKDLVTDVIIDFSEVKGEHRYDDPETGGTIYFTPGDYVVDGSIRKGLIVSGGNVTVQADFDGLIMAQGTVQVEGAGLRETANIALISHILDLIENDESLDMRKYFRAMKDDEKKTKLVAECIEYENWKRNE